MSKHRKTDAFKVHLSKLDAVALRDLARREAELRKDPEVGAATILREYAMPRVHDRLAELKQEAVRSNDDRRGAERREGERRTALATR